jgi:hypothetical protein
VDPDNPQFALRVMMGDEHIMPVAGAAKRETNPHHIVCGLSTRNHGDMTPHRVLTGAAGFAEALLPLEAAASELSDLLNPWC